MATKIDVSGLTLNTKEAEELSMLISERVFVQTPLAVLDKKVYYEYYLNQQQMVNKSQAITNTAEEYHVSERTIIRAIDFMA